MERTFTLSIPARMRIDNAANIYPASLSRHYASLYRLSVTLTETVDPLVLQQALVTVSERIPTFRCGLRAGTFWWHLRRMDKDPEVAPAAPLSRFHFSDNGGFLYKVSAEGCRILLDVFHALADGTGSETFLLTLAGEYPPRRPTPRKWKTVSRPYSPAARENWKRMFPPTISRAAGSPNRVSATSAW